jgi:pyruvate/2-oxoglutarate dehydrogenase complex dihydrolipoamide acyltransferase (E2) component
MNKDFIPYPRSRRVAIDALEMASRRHIVHGFLKADVTKPRRILRETTGSDGRPLSFTAYIIACYARALRSHPAVQVYRYFPNRMIVFRDVDISTFIEHKDAQGIPAPHVIRKADTLSVREISEEIRAVKAGTHPLGWIENVLPLASRVPRIFRVLLFNLLKFNPNWMKRVDGTAQLSSFGMFGRGIRWGVGKLYIHTVGIWVGGIVEKPMAYQGQIALRDCLHLTVSIDHDIVDGGPAGRFAGTFIELLESGSILEEETTRMPFPETISHPDRVDQPPKGPDKTLPGLPLWLLIAMGSAVLGQLA